MITAATRTCDCDHGENDGRCGAPATKRHYCNVRFAVILMRLCDPCNTECHNREDERW